MRAVPSPRHVGVLVGLLLVALAGAAGVVIAGADAVAARGAIAAMSFLVAAVAIWRFARTWPGYRATAIAFGAIAVASVAYALADAFGVDAYRRRVSDLALLLLLMPFVLAARDESRVHLDEGDRREVAADMVLLTLALASIVYVWIRPIDASGAAMAGAATYAIFGSAILALFGSLTICVPTPGHVLRFVGAAALAVATIAFGAAWARDDVTAAPTWIPLVFAIVPVAIAAVSVRLVHDDRRVQVFGTAGVARTAITSLTIITACAALSIVAILDDERAIAGPQSTVILMALAVGVTLRILANQRASAEAFARAGAALTRQERALEETDAALEQVRETNESLRRSEEHLRLIFDAAVDGFVEVDHRGEITRANGAFGRMVQADPASLVDCAWVDLAAATDGTDSAFTTLQHGGQATITRSDGQTLHLEATASVIPTDPPRTLVLVRDVSAAKVAEQTIRSLFHFLQDRDEDRTRLLRRSNAAIEQERNRIARDLHDGPVQGVSAATLSLEAALLMIKAGDAERGVELLGTIREELAGEADALRHLMSGLRPPVLEERGLLPALREMLARFESDTGVVASFEGGTTMPVPADVETLAYRLVQEALTNVGRHANATIVTVHVDTGTGQLRVEVEDDGHGFETAHAREFLRSGRVGLASMRERVELASGTFNIRSTPGRGTAVTAQIPIDDEPLATPDELATAR